MTNDMGHRPDLTAAAARADRDELAARTEVLDKVGLLATLPDNMHCTAVHAARYYEVSPEVIRQTVARNRAEFDADGYVVLRRAEVSDRLSLTPDQVGMPLNAGSIALFTRRSILRIGMLLRDSDIARQVRDYLLDSESETRGNVAFLVPKSMPEALRLAADQYERAELEAARAVAAETTNRVLTARIEKDAPLIAKAEAHSVSTTAIHRQDFAREVKQWGMGRGVRILHEHVYELLRRKRMLIAGDRSDRNQATSHAIETGWARNAKGTADNGREYVTTYLTPKGQDIAWKWITAHVDEFGDLTPHGGAA